MTSSQNKFELRERLLASDTSDAALRADYQRKLNAMFETQLSIPKKIVFKFLVLFNIVIGILVLILALTETLRPSVRAALLLGVVFAGAWTVYLIRVLRRGIFRRRIDPPIAAGMAFAFSLMMCIVLTVAGMPTDKVLLTAMFCLIPAGLVLIRTVVEQSEMRTQERLVELQYNLARLAEKLGDDQDGAGSGVLR